MSTLSGQASKGEKTKPKFQSLDINSLYRVSRGENLEKQQQKSSSIYIKHGMQSLGKVPNARRAPANLPSLKAEHSGTDAAVPLVPPGAPGWGKQDSTTSQPITPTTQTPTTNSATPINATQQPSPQLTSHQAAIALPVTTTIPPHNKQLTPSAQPVPTDKLWSSVMSGQDVPHPPLYQSPQFQHEFPSLSAGDGVPTRTGSDAPYPSGLSLRPQTEGSWTQGGQRVAGGEGGAAPRPGSGPLGAPPQLAAQVGLQQQQPFHPQIRGVMPPFMYKGNNFQQGSGAGTQNPNAPSAVNGRGNRPADNRPPRLADREPEEIAPRPIIKEEELSRMDEIGKDMGWAETDEIDYNQKLAFSDDESEKNTKKESRRNQQDRSREGYTDAQMHQWSSSRSSTSRGRSSEEEDVWMQRRSQTDKEMEIVVQRAKQRKEEEEKRFNEERKQGAAKKLMELEEKIQKRDRDNHEGVGTINPSTVPAKPINHVDIPLPDFQKEKERDTRERDSRSRTPNELMEDKNQAAGQGSSFRHLTQIEGKNFPRKHQKPSDREPRDRDRDVRDQNGPSFSRHFQNDLPPRFLKHQRNSSNSNTQQQQQYHQFDNNRWVASNQNPPKPHGRMRQDSPEKEREIGEDHREYKRQSSEDSYRSSHHSQHEVYSTEMERYEEVQENRHHQGYEYSRRDEEKWQKERQDDRWHKEKEKKAEHPARQGSDDWGDKKEKPVEKYERPARPDSHELPSARPMDYMGSWSESAYETPYEEKRREHVREDRRVVPGPITKERMEADDMRSEKRNLTQLKRGQPVDIKLDNKKEDKEESDGKKEPQVISAWADAIPAAMEEAENKFEEKKPADSHRMEPKQFGEQKKSDKDDYKERGQTRARQYPQNKGWGSGPNDYHSTRAGWQKRPPSRGHKSGRPVHSEYHGTDSDGSMDEHSVDSRDQKSPKLPKKLEKDDKNRENKQEKFVSDQRKQEKPEKKDSYVPRGEPSRHGRGGGNFRSGRLGGLGKRIDGYGPPPSKSPFGHHEDKEKKASCEETPSDSAPIEDKTKQNQQALAAGIIGKIRTDTSQALDDKNKSRMKLDNRKSKPKGKDDVCDTNSENSDEKDKRDGRKPQGKPQGARTSQNLNRGRSNPPPRLGGDKRSYDNIPRQNSNNSLKKDDKLTDQNILANAIADISLKNRDDADQIDDKDDKSSVNGDSEGFQEVKSKKAVKERQKSADDKQVRSAPKTDFKDVKIDRDRKKSSATQLLTQQQIQNIPSLMATPVNPPPVLPQPKNQFERPRQTKLAPRFAKQKLQKAQMQQQHGMCDVNDMNKVNPNMGVYGMKDAVSAPAPVSSCAWDKPLGPQLRNLEHDAMLGVTIEGVKGLEQAQASSQGASPNNEKMLGKPSQLQDKTLLDGSTPPVNTIIFENTNFKSAPGPRNSRNDKPRSKLEEGGMDNSVMSSFNKSTMNELLQSKNDNKSEPIQLPLFKEDTADMKLDFFGPDLQFTDDKASKALCMTKSIHAITSGNNTVDSLDIKIASVKKVWETSEQEGEDNQISFVGPPLDSNVFNQGKDTPDDNHEGYSPSPNQTASTTTNVCKVKPTQQVSGGGQTVLSSTSHQQHSGIVAPGLMGNPLSPPPMAPVIGAGVSLGPQQFTANQHIGYQAGLSGSTQFGMSAIPSPPTVPLVYNSTQQLQAAAQSAGLYGAFQIDQSGVLGGQGRSQFSQYPNYHGLGQTASSPYSTQSVYLQTAPPHPPPTAQAPPELYPNMNNYRLSATPFGQNQQLNNPTTVLISSTSNSLMSASVKPSSQQISAIGTKAGGVGQAYQQQSQQGQQVYMTYDPAIQANYLPPSAGVMQRGPAGPVQNNVVPGLQPSSSYYSGSTGGQTGYFQQPGSSTMQSAQLQQHQAGYGLQGNVFGTHNQSHTNTGLQNYNSHFLTTSMQMAAAINAQQYRSGLAATPYMKGVGSQQIGDQSGRPQQLKSPSSQEVLSSVFNSGSQIPSPKSRQNCKHPPPQSSPTAQHKYNLYPGVGGQQNPNIQRYPAPIQRPVNFQQMQQSNSVNQKHRSNSNSKAPNRQYYGGQNNSLSSQSEKAEDSKISDSVALSSANSANSTGKAALGTSSAVTVNAATEKVKESIKEETAALKD